MITLYWQICGPVEVPTTCRQQCFIIVLSTTHLMHFQEPLWQCMDVNGRDPIFPAQGEVNMCCDVYRSAYIIHTYTSTPFHTLNKLIVSLQVYTRQGFLHKAFFFTKHKYHNNSPVCIFTTHVPFLLNLLINILI